MKNLVLVAFLALDLVLVVGVGCTPAQVQTAEQVARDLTTRAIGLLTLAEQNPQVVAEAKAAAVKAMQAADPKDAAHFANALAHIDAGNLATAKQVLIVAADAAGKVAQ